MLLTPLIPLIPSDENPVKPEDLAATLYCLTGIEPKTHIYDRDDRPLPIGGKPILDIVACLRAVR